MKTQRSAQELMNGKRKRFFLEALVDIPTMFMIGYAAIAIVF